MKLTNNQTTSPHTTRTKLSKFWQSIRHKLTADKPKDKSRAFRDSLLAAKPCYSTATPIYELYRSRRPATPHAFALLNAPIPVKECEVDVPSIRDETSEEGSKNEAQAEYDAGAGPDFPIGAQPEPNCERSLAMVSTQFSSRSRESLSLRGIRPPTRTKLVLDYIAYNPFRPDLSAPTPWVLNDCSNGTEKLVRHEEVIARLSREKEWQEDTIRDLSHQLSVSERRIAHLQRDKSPAQRRWRNRKTMGGWWLRERMSGRVSRGDDGSVRLY